MNAPLRHELIAQSLTSMDNWLPSVRSRMDDLGLKSFQQLWRRVKEVSLKYPDFLGEPHYPSINQCVHGEPRHIFLLKQNGYCRSAYALAIALGTDVRTLFGPARNSSYNQTIDTDSIHQAALHRLVNTSDPQGIYLAKEFRAALNTAMDRKLTKKQKETLKIVFGINGSSMTVAELAQEENCSHQCVSQRVTRALELLSNATELQPFRSLIRN